MAYSKIILNGETLMDVTSDTVDIDKMMQGYTAHDKTGMPITGAIVDGNNLEYGLIDSTSSMVGVGKVGSMIIK